MKKRRLKDMKEYKNWLMKEHDFEISDKTQNYYDLVTGRIKEDFVKTNFWNELISNLHEYNDEYLLKTGYNLLITYEPQIHIKEFDSFLMKTFRKNILENKNWPKRPSDGWALPNNWYSKINDIVRTLFVVKYLDGVDFFVGKLKELSDQKNLSCNSFDVFFEAREEGYYAAHTYVSHKFEIPKIDWDTKKINISIEIQITTQLQEVIRKLLHKYYRERRKRYKKEDIKWQWNPQSDEFVANYLGHILHYVEGMIVDIREKQMKEI